MDKVLTEYRPSFELSKYNFCLPRIECIGHDLTTDGKYPTHSKVQLITEWPLPPHSVSLLSFIGMCSFNSTYVLWFKSNIGSLRRLQRLYYC